MSMDLNKPYYDFKGKYGKLGYDPKERFLDFKKKYEKLEYDPKGRFLYLGKSRNNNIWLAMAPWIVSMI